MDHLDEVARAARAAVQVAVFGGAAELLPAGRAGRRLDTWGQRGENGVDAPDDRFITADHQAVPSLCPPNPAAGPHVHIVDALRFQFGSAADVIVVVGVAAVDDHVITFEKWDEGLERRIHHGGRHHHPDGAGRFQFLREVFERCCPDRSVFGERLCGFRMEVVNDALVACPQKAPHHVGSHSAQSDHAQFHMIFLSLVKMSPMNPSWSYFLALQRLDFSQAAYVA